MVEGLDMKNRIVELYRAGPYAVSINQFTGNAGKTKTVRVQSVTAPSITRVGQVSM